MKIILLGLLFVSTSAWAEGQIFSVIPERNFETEAQKSKKISQLFQLETFRSFPDQGYLPRHRDPNDPGIWAFGERHPALKSVKKD